MGRDLNNNTCSSHICDAPCWAKTVYCAEPTRTSIYVFAPFGFFLSEKNIVNRAAAAAAAAVAAATTAAEGQRQQQQNSSSVCVCVCSSH